MMRTVWFKDDYGEYVVRAYDNKNKIIREYFTDDLLDAINTELAIKKELNLV